MKTRSFILSFRHEIGNSWVDFIRFSVINARMRIVTAINIEREITELRFQLACVHFRTSVIVIGKLLALRPPTYELNNKVDWDSSI